MFNNPLAYTDPSGYFGITSAYVGIPTAYQATFNLGRLRISFSFNLRTRRFSIGIPIGFGKLPVFGPTASTGGLSGALGGGGGIGNCFADAGCSATSGVFYLDERDKKYQRKPDSIEPSGWDAAEITVYTRERPDSGQLRELQRAPLEISLAPVLLVGGGELVLARAGVAVVAGGAARGAFDVAKAGGRHAGFLKNYAGRTPAEIQNGIASIEKRIAEHQSWIANPQSKIPNFGSLDPRQQAALINSKWPSDIARQQEQLDILRGLLGGN